MHKHKFSNFLEESTLEYHDTLNPKLFDLSTQKLLPEVRSALLKFGSTWADFAKIPESTIQDYYMTGGNANFNYTSQSDIDVHVVCDRRGIPIPSMYLDDYLQDKKALWQVKHRVTVRGYPLEPYAQDVGERFPLHQGVYSLISDSWVLVPSRTKDNHDSPVLGRKIEYYRNLINSAIHHKASVETVKSLKDKLSSMRSAGLERSGEFSIENLVFKELRNMGLVDALREYELTAQDRGLSLE